MRKYLKERSEWLPGVLAVTFIAVLVLGGYAYNNSNADDTWAYCMEASEPSYGQDNHLSASETRLLEYSCNKFLEKDPKQNITRLMAIQAERIKADEEFRIGQLEKAREELQECKTTYQLIVGRRDGVVLTDEEKIHEMKCQAIIDDHPSLFDEWVEFRNKELSKTRKANHE